MATDRPQRAPMALASDGQRRGVNGAAGRERVRWPMAAAGSGRVTRASAAAGELKGRPIERMPLLAELLDLRGAERVALGEPLGQRPVEGDHQVAGRAILDLPQARDDGAGSCVEKAAGEADDVVAAGDPAQAG